MNRRANNAVRFILENVLPPVIRDARWFMSVPARLVFGRRFREYLDFKTSVQRMPATQFRGMYDRPRCSLFDRPTDLNEPCIARALRDVDACRSVLDVGCGNAYFTGLMAQRVPCVVGVDVAIPDPQTTSQQHRLAIASLEHLPFPDRSFDAVVCTHTLEHVPKLHRAMAELRRVARRSVIVVVPKERPYRYTLNLHVHFFPYPESLTLALAEDGEQPECCELGGDLYYRELKPAPEVKEW